MTSNCQLYLITPPQIDNVDAYLEALKAALGEGDIACLQLRLKSIDDVPAADNEIVQLAEAILPITNSADVALLINDRPDLASKVGADGVHIGQSDASYADARALLGDDASIGVTCHNSRHLGLVAGEAGADYVAFGAFYPTQTKAAATVAEPALLEWWSHATTVPSVAIGGITPANCGPLVSAGADFLAVSSAVWSHADGPGHAVKAFTKAIQAA